MLGELRWRRALRLGYSLLAAGAFVASMPASKAAEPAAAPAAEAAPGIAEAATTTAASVFTEAELRKLLAPFALYPDTLLAQLPAGLRLSGRHRPRLTMAGEETRMRSPRVISPAPTPRAGTPR